MNIKNIIAVIGVHLLSVLALLTTNWTNESIISLVVLYVVTGCLGISVGYHRLLSHRSFEPYKWLEYILVTCGALAMQLGPTKWSNIHKEHHTFTDTEYDPHSPTRGFWWSYYGWLLPSNYKYVYPPRDSYYGFLDKYYAFLQIPLAIILYIYGGLPAVLWGIPLRICLVWHLSWINNSFAHTFGNQLYKTRDNSRNNWVVALFTFGEGWHNNHHAFPKSAKIGMRWWQIDMGWMVISTLNFFGLLKKVTVPSMFTINSKKR